MNGYKFYTFWGRAMEPWDGPAIIAYSDGYSIGARLDRNGFRPARWALTEDCLYLSSEAGSFDVDETSVEAKGALHAGTGVSLNLQTGTIYVRDPGESLENRAAAFDARLEKLESYSHYAGPSALHQRQLFQLTQEEFEKMLIPMALTGKEPLGSMGDTARLAVFSELPRSFFDYFYQGFAQVTNPPLDYLRERVVTDLRVFLGAKPNIFAPKELIPVQPAIELKSPILSLSQFQALENRKHFAQHENMIIPRIIDITFERERGLVGFQERLQQLESEVLQTVNNTSILILSDRSADAKNLPIPSVLALRTVVNVLNRSGRRLHTSVVVHSGEVRSAHHVAVLIGFGAAAVCPYLALEIAAYANHPELEALATPEREKNLLLALTMGLLKIMAKSGISVVRSYQSAKRFTTLGLGPELMQTFFPGLSSAIGGLELEEVVSDLLRNANFFEAQPAGEFPHLYLLREHNRELQGERHSMTSKRSRTLHKMLAKPTQAEQFYQDYLAQGDASKPVNIRHLLDFQPAEQALELEQVEPTSAILKRFGSGAMSFGAISAESQRDIFLAMRQIGGRSNSGEGGENPYYYTEGISASTKQVASGRFGVTAEYLVSAQEIQIKIAQGAKPGEGGQLMGLKVTAEIARARHATPGTSLISPPPLHDIYSIEDLKQLIYELKQLKPGIKVSVKLVAGHNVGTIAVGVAKAGADIIYICGYDGGTGAAVLGSMKHAGLPWELGLLEAHRALSENALRQQVELRTDGGLHSGRDIVMGALLGAEGFEFGKLLLIAQGCIMARVCEKNTCPRGIATHDPRFQKNYQGSPEAIVSVLTRLAQEVREHLAILGLPDLQSALGRSDLLRPHPQQLPLIAQRRLKLDWLLSPPVVAPGSFPLPTESANPLNQQIVQDTQEALSNNQSKALFYQIGTADRAIPATLSGVLAQQQAKARRESRPQTNDYQQTLSLTFRGSAGQGFGVFLTRGVTLRLFGEANDSVCKSMSGGNVVIRPHPGARYRAHENSIIGNCALYGATGGSLFVSGLAGDRFAVRNSGATAVVEGTGLHCCEYMTGGLVVVLGPVSQNVGAGMTGGTLYLYGPQLHQVNGEYLVEEGLETDDFAVLKPLLDRFLRETDSLRAKEILASWEQLRHQFHRLVPVGQTRAQQVATEAPVAQKSIN